MVRRVTLLACTEDGTASQPPAEQTFPSVLRRCLRIPPTACRFWNSGLDLEAARLSATTTTLELANAQS